MFEIEGLHGECPPLQKIIQNNKKYILHQLSAIGLNENHPFLQNGIEESAELHHLAILTALLSDSCILERFFKTLNQQKNLEIYQQFWTDVQVLLHIILSSLDSSLRVPAVFFDEKTSSNHNKDVDFMLKYSSFSKNVKVENKKITCDPFMREKNFKLGGFIKKLFKDINLEDIITKEELEKYTILKSSTHYQVLKDEIKKINKKYINVNDRNECINIGVINIDYATSIEEFFSYFENSKRGLFVNDKRIFKNIDAIVLVHNVPSPDTFPFLKCYTFICNESMCKEDIDILQKIGFCNIVYINGSICEDAKMFAEEIYIKLKTASYHGILNFYREDIADEKIQEYHKELSSAGLHAYLKE